MEHKELEDLINLLVLGSTASKRDLYLQIQAHLKKQTDKYISTERLLTIIKEDLEKNKFVSEALFTLILCANHKHLQEELCEVLYCNSGHFHEMIPEFCKLINENLLDIENILSHTNVTWNKKILDCIGSVSDKVVFKIYLDFINIDVVDTIFKTKSNAIRDSLIDFVLLKDSFSINCYDMEEQKRITSRLKDSYVGKIDELRIQNNMDWYKLCMFTMKYCGKLLHSEIELTNIILHYVEIGFKTKTVQDRLLSYDCWKVLIDICNLDSSYISNPKQLRLLIKPLKIKLSKNEEVVQKRFDIWFYLATILQEKILHCVEELVKFCFEMKDSGITSEICIDSNIIKDTWLKRVEILISIIGHYEDDSNCLKIENFNFTNPIVSCSNFPKLDNLLLNSIYVSCKIISKWDSGSYKRMKIRCLWGSTFKIIQNLNEKIKEDVLHNVSEVLQLILQDCITKNMYFKDILMPIFSLLSSFKEPICNPSVFNEIIIFPIIRFMLFQQMLDPAWSKEVIDLIRHIPKAGNKPFYFNRISELLKTSPQVNNSFVILFWLYIIEELYDICKMPRENFSDFNEDAMFLLTLILTWNNLEEIQNFVLSAWKRTFSEICTISNVFGEDFLRNCENLLKLHPETGINILTILPDISEILFNNKSYKKFVVAPSLLNVIHLCLQNPDIRKSKILLLIPILKKIFSFCTGGDTVEATSVVLKMCKCIEYILKLHRIYEILEFLKEIAPKLSTNIKKKLPNSLKATIKNLATNDNNIPSKDAVEVLSQFDEKETERNAQVFVRPVSTRSAKIANMAKDNAHSASLNENMLKIFSNEVRKSQEDNVIMVNSKLNRNTCNIDEDSADFVVINKEVMIDKSKLSNHQKETMNKQNRDIPALYQDLSQSQHDSGTNSNSLSENKIDLTLDDNFKDIIINMKKKNNILQENFETDVHSIFKNTNNSFRNNNSTNLKNSTHKVTTESISSQENILPKVDLNMKFENSLKGDKYSTIIENAENNHDYKQKSTNSTNLQDNQPTPKFEECALITKTGPTSAVCPNHNLDSVIHSPNKKLNRKPENKPVRSRRMSDSHIVLKKFNFNDDSYGFEDDKSLVKDNDFFSKGSTVFCKHLKLKSKELKSKVVDKHKNCIYSAKCNKTSQYMEQRCKDFGSVPCINKQNNSQLKQKYRSLDNLTDIAQKLDEKKVKKCFKIIQNDVSSSIKLRISITNEDNNLEQSIIKQLDAEISNIDANLQSNICLLNRKNNLVTNSESIFESLDTLGKSEQLNLQDCNQSKVIKNEPLNHKNVKKNAISLKDSGGEIDTSRIKEEQVVTKTRKQRELDRIKMDIVGADEFVITTPRKRRASRLTFAKKEKSSNGIPTQTIIERKTGKNKGNSFNSPIHTLKVTPENSDIKVVLGSRSNCIVTAKNKWEQTKLKSYNSSIDRDNISLDQDKRNKIPNKAKVKSKSITNSITSLKNGSHRRKKKQERKANVSAKIEIDSMPTAMIFNNQEANNINLNVSISGQEPFIVSSSATTLQENSTAYALRNKNKAEDSQNATEPLISTSNDNLFESVIQRIDLHSEDDTNQEVDKVEYDRPGLEDGQISFSTLNELLNVKKLETLADIACNNVVNNESTLDNSSTSFKETKSDNKSSSILSETDEITGRFAKETCNYGSINIFETKNTSDINDTESVQSKTLNIEVIGPDVPTTPAISSADSYAIQKSLPYKKETFSQNETLTCNPYINIYKEKDVVDKLEKYCPGAIETLIKDLDFEDLPLTFETPKRENILCSPLCDDTPDKNKELVKNTSDISPIKLEFTESRICERNMTPTENDKPCIKNASSRSTKLLNLLSSPSNLTSKVLQSPRKFQPELSSLSTQRVHKIISKCQPPIEKQDDIVSHKSLSISFITEEQNVLKFTRELPSPLAAPNTSILKKRKFSDVTDDISLYSKRKKRVNFSDPPTTSQKIYFTEKEEKTSDGKTDKSLSFISELNALKASSICPKLATCTIDINDVVTLLSRDLVKHFHSANIRTVGDLASLNDSQVSQLEFLGEPRLERITEALDAISRNYCKEKDGFPICVDLVDCSHSLDKLCAIDNSFKTFHSNNIRTIGDLAKLTKPEVLQLSLKFSSVLQALQKYHRMLNKKKILTKQMQEERNERGICTEVTETNILQDNFDGSIAPVRETAPCDALANKEVLRRTVSEEIQYIKKQYSSDEIRDIFIHLRDIVRGKFELNK